MAHIFTLILSLITYSGAAAPVNQQTKVNAVFQKELHFSFRAMENFLINGFNKSPSSGTTLSVISLSGRDDKSHINFDFQFDFSETTDEYQRLKATRLGLIRNLYSPKPSPYSGDLSKKAPCPSVGQEEIHEYSLQKENVSFDVIEAPANSRNNFGACVKEDFIKQGAYVLIKTSHGAGKLRLFIPYTLYRKDSNVFKNILTTITFHQ